MKELNQSERLWLWLNSITGAQPLLFHRIIDAAGGVEALFEMAAGKRLQGMDFLAPAMRQKLCDTANEGYMEQYVRWLAKREIQVIVENSQEYPVLLQEIYAPPTLLFVRGTLPQELDLPIAMVGMRQNTPYGERIARKLGEELARNGATIVSGMALGIDRYSALGALAYEEAEHPTVAVLGSGIDVIYPSSNARLYEKIIERGAVVSEFLPGTRPLKGNFPIRNRIISGLSLGVVVVEAGERSGTSITANYALEQNREIFAVPGDIDRKQSAGPNALIRQGWAKPVFGVEDILEEFGRHAKGNALEKQVDISRLNQPQRDIYLALQEGPKSADEICQMLSLDAAQVNQALTSLQFSGIMKQLPGRLYSI